MKKIRNLKFVIHNSQKGMTYIELIVVLSIFSVMTSVVLFNYGGFQAKVDIKNLASDIALKIVEAQKSSLSGNLPPIAQQGQITSTWKPSYGIFLDRNYDNKSFVYFTDLDQNGFLANTTCVGVSECLEQITIAKANYISNVTVFYPGGSSVILTNLHLTFKRPDSSAIIKSNGVVLNSPIAYVQVDVVSPKGATAVIKIYPSGRIQVN